MTKFSENFTYKVDGKKVSSTGDFYFFIQGNDYDIEINGLEVNAKRKSPTDSNTPFFLDETISNSFARNKDKTEEEILNELRADLMTTSKTDNECKKSISTEDLNKSIGAPSLDWHSDNTGGTVFEKVQDTPLSFPFCAVITPTLEQKVIKVWERKDVKQYVEDWFKTRNVNSNIFKDFDKEHNQKSEGVGLNIMPNGVARGKIFTYESEEKVGKKESQTVKKAPIFTYCKQMKNAVEALALRSLYGHERYEKGDDWENFARVENGEFEYANASFRHALGIGEEDEENHLIAEAWNSMAKLELYLRKNK